MRHAVLGVKMEFFCESHNASCGLEPHEKNHVCGSATYACDNVRRSQLRVRHDVVFTEDEASKIYNGKRWWQHTMRELVIVAHARTCGRFSLLSAHSEACSVDTW